MRRLGWALLLLFMLTPSASAQSNPTQSWLDLPLSDWNQPGMAVPAAVLPDVPNPDCAARARPPETAEDHAITDAGWNLYGDYRGGWGVLIVHGTSGYDGMCRPNGFQDFVFADGAFAGTISPEAMGARATGAGGVISLIESGLTARFVRYAPTDPLCCPSPGAVVVDYRVDRTPDGPVLRAITKTVEPR